jgi:hypothetical protein
VKPGGYADCSLKMDSRAEGSWEKAAKWVEIVALSLESEDSGRAGWLRYLGLLGHINSRT